MDTAVKRSSVISRAKELSYVPRSRRASKTVLTITMQNIANETLIDSVVLPAGTRFSSKVNDGDFTFSTTQSVALNKTIQNGSTVFIGSIVVYEGVLTQHTTAYDQVANLISIPNPDIDTTTLKVEVYENLAWTPFYLPQQYLDLTSTTNAFLLQEGFAGFEIYFGDNTMGRKPLDVSSVRMTYMVTSGDTANGALNFKMLGTVVEMISTTIVTITNAQSDGGQLEESIESIKLNARNAFSSQNRAVTTSDYSALTIQNFSNVKDVISWSGSDNIPPRFGRVILCIQPVIGDVASSAEKSEISAFLQKKGVGNVKVEFYDPEYVNLEVTSTVKYDVDNIKVGVYELGYIVQSTISAYANEIKKFGSTFRYSTLVGKIDAANYAIMGNETKVKINKELLPTLFSANSFSFSFVNEVKKGSIGSTYFFDGKSNDRLKIKDVNGALHVYYSLNGTDVLYIANVGTVDYVTGGIVITNLTIAGLEDSKFKLSAETESFDIHSSKNVILKLDQENLIVKVIKDTK